MVRIQVFYYVTLRLDSISLLNPEDEAISIQIRHTT
jgi:hypothetical protein